MVLYETSSYRWKLGLPAGLLVASVILRATLSYQRTPNLLLVLSVLAGWILILAIEPTISRRWGNFFFAYILIQIVPPLLLMCSPGLDYPDYFAVLFVVLCMQVMGRLPVSLGWIIVGLISVLSAWPMMLKAELGKALGYTLIYAVANTMLSVFALAVRRAVEAQVRNLDLAAELDEANWKLQEGTRLRARVAAERTRQKLARELHDSITQTVFSMTLATESALLLLKQDPSRVADQLDHISQLSQQALSQMQRIVSELKPQLFGQTDLAEALRCHLADRYVPDGLEFSVAVDGDSQVTSDENEMLFSIAREAINNIIKHSNASDARIRLHLGIPPWMEVSDNGRGFVQGSSSTGGVGLASMSEQAEERGWAFSVSSATGAGTTVLVSKTLPSERVSSWKMDPSSVS